MSTAIFQHNDSSINTTCQHLCSVSRHIKHCSVPSLAMGSSNSTPVDEHGCPAPAGSDDYIDRGTAWSGMRWAALGCTGTTALISLCLIFQHLRRYRAPKEQRQIIRIIFSIPLYSVIAFLEVWRYKDATYIDPLGDLYEAFGLW